MPTASDTGQIHFAEVDRNSMLTIVCVSGIPFAYKSAHFAPFLEQRKTGTF